MPTEQQKESQFYYRRAKALHKCYVCGADTEQKPNGGYFVLCATCRGKSSTKNKQLREKRKAEQKCTICGAATDINPRTGAHYIWCAACQDRYYKHQREYRDRRKRSERNEKTYTRTN